MADFPETLFQVWLAAQSQKTGVPYDPNDKNYDYRKAYSAGEKPEWQPEHNQYRWSDIGKQFDYDGVPTPGPTR